MTNKLIEKSCGFYEIDGEILKIGHIEMGDGKVEYMRDPNGTHTGVLSWDCKADEETIAAIIPDAELTTRMRTLKQ